MFEPPIDIANYDKSRFDYNRYWHSRQYEHKAELLTLAKLLPKSGQFLIDLGGGYGRLMEDYSSRFTKNVILDYSENLLQIGRIKTESAGTKNVEFVKGNIYKLPFENESFDAALMIRVLHHLLKPQKALFEAARVLKPEGVLILEFANKIHLKARLRAVLRSDFKFVHNLSPYQQAKDDQIFYNFHPQQIREMLTAAGFRIEKKIGASNLRQPLLKRIIPLPLLLTTENLLQNLSALSLTKLNLAPSIFYLCRKDSFKTL